MKAKLTEIRKQRRYSEDFKRRIVGYFESGAYSVPQLEKLYGVGNASIYQWIYTYSTLAEKGCRIVEMKDSAQDKLQQLSNRLQQLEQIVGQKQMAIDYLEKMIELAGTELQIDIKKNYGTLPCSGLKTTKKR